MSVYNDIVDASKSACKLLAILIDPDKMNVSDVATFMHKVNQSIATHIFVGGSTVKAGITEYLVSEIKRHTVLPVVLFPGDNSQISKEADALLFLSLLSGRNPKYLIGEHVAAIPLLRCIPLEIIPTAYILIDGGAPTAVQRVTQTQPMPQDHIGSIVDTAKAGELLGMKLIYLEAGSGAQLEVSSAIIQAVHEDSTLPLIVGGGIRTLRQLTTAYENGADMVVIGTAFEYDISFFEELKTI